MRGIRTPGTTKTKMSPEIIRIVGGAGTGKTSALMGEIEQAVGRFGIESIGFSSMTRAARHEAAERAATAFNTSYDELVSDGWFKTLHATCYRALGISRGRIAPLHDVEWLSKAFGRELQAPTRHCDRRTRDDVFAALDAWDYARHTAIGLTNASLTCGLNPAVVLPLINQYEIAKRVHHRIDFTDLLCFFVGLDYTSLESPPRRVKPQGALPPLSMWLFDECQDMSRLLDQVARRLASSPTVERVVLVGDPFQAIHSFMGSSADHFMRWPTTSERVLGLSYRCGESILEFGESALQRMRYGYWDRRIRAHRPGGHIDYARSLETLVRSVDPRDDWLLLGRSHYEANNIAAAVTAAGMPWQWTRQVHDETEERHRRGHRACIALERGLAIEANEVSYLMAVTPQALEGRPLWARGVKFHYAPEKHRDRRFLASDLESIGATPLLVDALRNGTWPEITKGQGRRFRDTVARYGDAVAAHPPIKIGTIHSAKGAEAENVGLLHSIPRERARRQHANPENWNEERRIEYVGITRAKSRLIIATPMKRGSMTVLC